MLLWPGDTYLHFIPKKNMRIAKESTTQQNLLLWTLEDICRGRGSGDIIARE
jgi:hypothetical protein